MALAITEEMSLMARMASSLPGYGVVDLVGIAVGIGDSDDGDAES